METKQTVWTYWEGPCPEYVRLCLDTIRRRCDVTVLDRASFDAIWLDDRNVPIDELWRPSPAMLGVYRRLEEQIESGFAAIGAAAYA